MQCFWLNSTSKLNMYLCLWQFHQLPTFTWKGIRVKSWTSYLQMLLRVIFGGRALLNESLYIEKKDSTYSWCAISSHQSEISQSSNTQCHTGKNLEVSLGPSWNRTVLKSFLTLKVEHHIQIHKIRKLLGWEGQFWVKLWELLSPLNFFSGIFALCGALIEEHPWDRKRREEKSVPLSVCSCWRAETGRQPSPRKMHIREKHKISEIDTKIATRATKLALFTIWEYF